MVTKPQFEEVKLSGSSVLAKIHMVTKPLHVNTLDSSSSVLAKIHMVTKRTFSLCFSFLVLF